MEHEVSALYGWLHTGLDSAFGAGTITDQALMAWFIVVLAAVAMPLMSRRFSLEAPGKAQQMLEIGVSSVNALAESFIGHNGRKYIWAMGPLAFFILMCNLLAFIPGFQPPTADLNTTVALGVLSFLLYNAIGIRAQGAHYLKQFIGSPLWLSPLMIPIEILSHLSRPLSLSVRLFGNIFAEHTLAGVFFMLLPIGLPVVFMPLGVFVSFIPDLRVRHAVDDLHRRRPRARTLTPTRPAFRAKGVLR